MRQPDYSPLFGITVAFLVTFLVFGATLALFGDYIKALECLVIGPVSLVPMWLVGWARRKALQRVDLNYQHQQLLLEAKQILEDEA